MMFKKIFLIISIWLGLFANYSVQAASQASHESPSAGSIESGIGIIRGWACDATTVKITIDDAINLELAYGTSRADTQAICGDSDNGYGATFNWNLLSPGQHRMRTYLDDLLISDINFQVNPLNDEFLTGAQRELPLNNFPEIGDQLTLTWSQTHQNFVISDFQSIAQASHPITEVRLSIDVSQLTGQAEYLLSPAGGNSLSLETAGLTILNVSLDNNPLAYNLNNGDLELTLPTIRERLLINYSFAFSVPFEGLFSNGASSYTWPYYCENLFPCISDPAVGFPYQLQLTGVENGKTAIYPSRLNHKSPAYQLGWVTGDYTYRQLGVTDAGTRVGLWTLPNHQAAAETGTAKLAFMFDWLEKKLGSYPFGNDVASVDVNWPNTAGGGIEHHPYWHIETASLNNPEVHIHEATHGWFGNGARLSCWEDFVLSEGVASYLAAAAIGAAYGASEEDLIWQGYQQRLQSATQSNNHIAWPDSCNVIDILDIFTDIPYMKGAFFFRDLEQIIGRENLLDALGGFYRQYRGNDATFEQLLNSLNTQTQFDPHPLANAWLRSLTLP